MGVDAVGVTGERSLVNVMDVSDVVVGICFIEERRLRLFENMADECG